MGQQQPMTKEQISQALKNNAANAKIDSQLAAYDENIEKARLDLQTAVYNKQRYIMQVANARNDAAEQNLANFNAQLKTEADKAMQAQPVGAPGPAAPPNPGPAAVNPAAPTVAPPAPEPAAVEPAAPAAEKPAAEKPAAEKPAPTAEKKD